jgi:hypothetical protein
MTDVLDLLKRSDPVDARELRSHEPPAEVLERILASGPERSAASRSRVLIPAIGMAAAAVVALVVLAGGGARPDEAVAAALRGLAQEARAERPVAAELDPGEFIYVRNDARPVLAMRQGFLILVPQTNESWRGRDRGLYRNRAGQAEFLTARDRQAWVEAGRPRLPGNEAFEDVDEGGIERSTLPTDPDALLDRLERDASDGDHGNSYIFSELIADHLRESGVSPAQRAALYEVAARLPGIELVGPRRDREGRRGMAFASDDDEGRHRVTLIIDPDTGDLLAKRSVALPGNPIPAGTVVEDSTYSPPAIVGGIGERP